MARFTYFIWVSLVFAGCQVPVEANQPIVFLGKMPVDARVSEEDLKFETSLSSQIEKVLGSDYSVFTKKRLGSIEHSLMPIVAAVPKNEKGKLGQAAVSYVLYRLFVQRHAWFVKGLEPFKALGEWNYTSAISVLDQRVPAYITDLFQARMSEGGFGLHEVAVLAATLEHLVHKESLQRLFVAYKSLKFSPMDVLSTQEEEQVMDTYMAMYILGPLIRNLSNVSARWVRFLRANVSELYPGFPETQRFLRDVSESVAPAQGYFHYSDMANLVEEVGDQYGRWQDYECHALKDMLVEMEERGPGGAGRVRLAEFYGGSLYDGKWQLCEKIDYLRKLGALDESDPDNLRVIIPNYINGPSNCVASSSYYSVCCINECEEILNDLEIKIAAPESTPEAIANIVAQLPSATVVGNRTLSPWLLRRLDDVAEHHAGVVPLHGRLFAQWLHYAYPRECPYPHAMGTTAPQTADEYVIETRQDFAASKEDMKQIIALPVPRKAGVVEETSDMAKVLKQESAMWTMEEELVVPPSSANGSLMMLFQPWLLGFACVLAVALAAFSLLQGLHKRMSSGKQRGESMFLCCERATP